MTKVSYPWVRVPDQDQTVDLHAEWIGLGKLDPRYEAYLYYHYHTRNKQEILRRLNKDRIIPIWFDQDKKVHLIRRASLALKQLVSFLVAQKEGHGNRRE